MGTKNNPKNRAKGKEKKKHGDREVEPILYFGIHSGHGKYMTARYVGTADDVVSDASGKPIPWDSV